MILEWLYYLDARLAELKWAVVVHELALKQREEQRYLKERMRDEEKAKREIEQKLREAAREKELQRLAVEEAEKYAHASRCINSASKSCCYGLPKPTPFKCPQNYRVWLSSAGKGFRSGEYCNYAPQIVLPIAA
jgi:hypothetical protein